MQNGATYLNRRQWLIFATVVIVAMLANWWTMLFSGDGMDIDAFRQAVHPITLHYIPELLSPYWGWAYRPTFLLYFASALRFIRADPFVLHVVSLSLHLLALILLGKLVRRLFHNDKLALLSVALFAAGTWNNQAISWICSTTTLFAAIGYLVAIHMWLSWRRSGHWGYYLGVLLSCIFACASKEDAYPLVAALVVLDYLIIPDTPVRSRWHHYLPVAAIVANFVFISNIARQSLMSVQQASVDDVKIVPIALHIDLPAALQNFLGALLGVLEGTEPSINFWAVLLIGAYCLMQGRVPIVLFVWTLVTAIPVSLISGIDDTRFRYLPMLSGSILVAHLLQTHWGRWQELTASPQSRAVLTVLGVCIIRTIFLSSAGEFSEYDASAKLARDFLNSSFPLVPITLCISIIVAYVMWKKNLLPQDSMVVIILVAAATQSSVWSSALPVNFIALISPALINPLCNHKGWKNILLVVALWELPVITLPAFLLCYSLLTAFNKRAVFNSVPLSEYRAAKNV